MKTVKIFLPVAIVAFMVSGCQKESWQNVSSVTSGEKNNVKKQNETETTFSFDFRNGMQGWSGGFADYTVGEEELFELDFEHAFTPDELHPRKKGLYIKGHNRSDDLFMFVKTQVDGLQPNTTYNVFFDLELVSQYPENSVGIGGSPGASVYLKVGATQIEPLAVATDGSYVMNIDKGNQSVGGNDMVVIGSIGIEGDDFEYTYIYRNNSSVPFSVTTDANGKAWLIIGTDSGFEGLTELWYTNAEITFSEQ